MPVRLAESVRNDLGLVGDHGLPSQVEGFLEDAVRRGRFRQQRDIACSAARESDVRCGEAADGRVSLRKERDGGKVRRSGGEGRMDDRAGVRDVARRGAVAGARPLSGCEVDLVRIVPAEVDRVARRTGRGTGESARPAPARAGAAGWIIAWNETNHVGCGLLWAVTGKKTQGLLRRID